MLQQKDQFPFQYSFALFGLANRSKVSYRVPKKLTEHKNCKLLIKMSTIVLPYYKNGDKCDKPKLFTIFSLCFPHKCAIASP